jgi:hypothetical protein
LVLFFAEAIRCKLKIQSIASHPATVHVKSADRDSGKPAEARFR